MSYISFNLNNEILPTELINKIYLYIDDFEELIKLRVLNKYNKSLIDNNLHLIYTKLRINNEELPSINFKKLILEQRTKSIISSYQIEKLRHKEILNNPYYSSVRDSASKGHEIFKIYLNLRNNGFCSALSNIMAGDLNSNQIKQAIELKKLGIDKHGCLNLAENCNKLELQTAINIINKGFHWCYAALSIKKFSGDQIKKMIELKNNGLNDIQAFHKIETSICLQDYFKN